MKTTKTTNESKKGSTTVKGVPVAENFQRIENENEIFDVEFDNLEEDTIVFPDCEMYDDLPF
jgi:hypothetical protein